MAEHVDELGQLDRRPPRRKPPGPTWVTPQPPTAPHYLDVWAKYLRGLDPAHRPDHHQGARRLLVPVRVPRQLQRADQLMLDAGVDMVGVMLANPFTAERDIADIGASILAHAEHRLGSTGNTAPLREKRMP